MDLYQKKNPRIILSVALGLCLVVLGFFGASNESELLALAFYGLLIGGGLFLLGYSAVVWRRVD